MSSCESPEVTDDLVKFDKTASPDEEELAEGHDEEQTHSRGSDEENEVEEHQKLDPSFTSTDVPDHLQKETAQPDEELSKEPENEQSPEQHNGGHAETGDGAEELNVLPHDSTAAEETEEKPTELVTSSRDEDGGRENGIEAGTEEKKSPEAGGGKREGNARRNLKTTDGEAKSGHAAAVAPGTPKKVAQKVNSIIEGYTKKMSSGGAGGGSKPEVADKSTPKRGIRRSETESKGHISEIRERIERSASSAQSPRTPARGTGSTARDAGTTDGTGLEERRRQKADEWMNKVTKSSADNGVQSPSSRTVIPSSAGKGHTSAWKRKEEEVKREKEQREAAQKQLEEKRKKLEEERRSARESSRKPKDSDQTDSTRKEPALQSQKSVTTASRTTKTTTNTTPTTTTATTTTASETKSTLYSATSEDEKLKKQKALESRVRPLNIEGLDAEGLEQKVNELYQRILVLEEEKYDIETLLEKRENELNEIKVRTGDAKGKFVKPPLKKVIKKEET